MLLRAFTLATVLLTFFTTTWPAPRAAGADHTIRLATAPALSPGGKRLAFSWNGDIWVANTKGGVARRLTVSSSRDTHPVFSPDGRQLAFNSARNGSDQVFVMPAGGGAPQQWTFHSEGATVQQWQPDEMLLYASRDQFWRRAGRYFTVKPEPRSREQLVFDAYGQEGQLSPDGSRILFVREGVRGYRKGYVGSQAGQIWMFDRKQKSYKKLVDHPAGSRTPVWHPSGKQFYYCSAKNGGFELWRHEIKGGKETQLTDFAGDDSVLMPAISRNGSTLVFRRGFDFYRLNLEEENPQPEKIKLLYRGDDLLRAQQRNELEAATEVAFSSDGLEVAFVAGGDIWVMDTVLREPRQITSTAALESSPVFAPGDDALWYVSDSGVACDIYKATRKNENAYWWRNNEFNLQQITDDREEEANLTFSPDGSRLAFTRGRGDLWMIGADGKDAKRIIESWNTPSYDFSPDGKWIVYSLSNNNFNRDIYILPLDGSRKPYNLSSHPDNDYSPVWSPDGKMIAFTGRRTGVETDIHYVQLRQSDEETGSRDRKLKAALEKIKKLRKTPVKKTAPPEPAAKPQPAGKTTPAVKKEAAPKNGPENGPENDAAAGKPAAKPAASKPDAKKLPEVKIDFEDLAQRVHRVSIPNTAESDLLWSPDSKRLAFVASVNGKRGLYTNTPPASTSPRLLSTTTGSGAVWISQENKILWLVSGKPASLSAKGEAASYSFKALQTVDTHKYQQVVFDLCWRAMRDNWYDPQMNNRNWDEVRRKYSDMAGKAVDTTTLGVVVNMMLGELNGSHLGFYPSSKKSSDDGLQWSETTAHFGVRYDNSFAGPGWKIKDVIRNSPATRQRSRLLAGEIILSVDGVDVDPAIEPTAVLNGRLQRDIQLRVKNTRGDVRSVTLRPISFSTARSLLYEQWIYNSQQAVKKASGDTFGYVHIQGMNMSSFYRFEGELYSIAAGKDGLVIDVRENGGGSTTDHLLTILTQPTHAITKPRGGGRGYPHDRRVYATWSKPIVVLCNQNSFSNAEIFSHSIKTLKRGQVVGVPTAGGVISTGGTRIAGAGYLRMPFRGWFLLDGKDMELNGCVPHHVLWPEPGQMPQGKDTQLSKAIEVLQAEVKEFKNRKQPELEYASELRKKQ